MGKLWKHWQTVFSWVPKSLQMVDCSHEIKRHLLLGRKTMTKPRWHIEKQKHYFASKGLYSQSYGFSSSHVYMWELDHKEGWMSKNWCFWTVVLQMTLESLLDCKEIKPVSPKGNQTGIFIERTDAEAKSPVLLPPDEKSQLIGKDPDAGKAWGQEEKGVTEDEMVGWHHWLSGHEFEQTPGRSEGQGSIHGFTKSQTQLSNQTTTTHVIDWETQYY